MNAQTTHILVLALAFASSAVTAQSRKPRGKVPFEIEKPALAKSLSKVKISGFSVNNVTVEDAFKYLSVEYAKASGTGAGINFLLKGGNAIKQATVSLDLSAASIPATDIIYYLCLAAELNHRIDDFAVVVWKLKEKESINRY